MQSFTIDPIIVIYIFYNLAHTDKRTNHLKHCVYGRCMTIDLMINTEPCTKL